MKVTLLRCLVSASLMTVMLTATDSYAQAPSSKEPASKSLNKDLLVARWKAGNEDITLTKSGESYITINEKTCPGTWALRGKTLYISPARVMTRKGDPCSTDRAWQVTNLSATQLDMVDEAKNQLHLTRQK